jgi:heme oxygenase
MDNFISKLKDATSKLHSIAENAEFNKNLLGETLTKESYCSYLISKYHVYSALEMAILSNKNNPAISKIYMPELERKRHILNDLKAILPELPEKFPLLSSTESYVYHLNMLSRNSPELLAAHTYTNYLAEMAGGMIIKRILISKHGFKESELSLYNFKDIDEFKDFQPKYHHLINEIVGLAHIEDAFIEESKLAYIFTTVSLMELVA